MKYKHRTSNNERHDRTIQRSMFDVSLGATYEFTIYDLRVRNTIVKELVESLLVKPSFLNERFRKVRRTDISVENHAQTNSKLRQERHSRLFGRPGINSAQKMPLLTELEKSFSDRFYKYVAPTELSPTPKP